MLLTLKKNKSSQAQVCTLYTSYADVLQNTKISKNFWIWHHFLRILEFVFIFFLSCLELEKFEPKYLATLLLFFILKFGIVMNLPTRADPL